VVVAKRRRKPPVAPFLDVLDRCFGPEPEQFNWKPVDERKIIPFHDCEYVDARTWTYFGMTEIMQCRVCHQQPPAPPREDP
jgi:hypothetical protein